MAEQDDVEFRDEFDTELDPQLARSFSQAVLFSTDWTVETIVSQLTRGNIELNPRFQRRDAWSPRRKSQFIESLILGLPVPQIVLAEKPSQRGRYIVLDGKQRLLSLMQFTGNADQSPNNGFRLSGLEARPDLARTDFRRLEEDPSLVDELNAFSNYTIRTVVIRNWPSAQFLHTVFLRLNTGSVKLSPQELRQALFPGVFSDTVDDAAIQSQGLRVLLSRADADPRMRDVELLVRFLAFQIFLPYYAGRMKDFLDYTCSTLNRDWVDVERDVRVAIDAFELAIARLIEIFGQDDVARKPGSRSFNRAIFDTLMFYGADPGIGMAMAANPDGVKIAYAQVHEIAAFQEAIESDTAGVPHTLARLRIWGEKLMAALDLNFNLPAEVLIQDGGHRERMGIQFTGLWS
jgi:hypothetical protein